MKYIHQVVNYIERDLSLCGIYDKVQSVKMYILHVIRALVCLFLFITVNMPISFRVDLLATGDHTSVPISLWNNSGEYG